ncbi:MAG: DNA recombination protein RmuC [Clostridia bacterium]|nr:DNA recombination protein RmuC [Clostridia bacterium]
MASLMRDEFSKSRMENNAQQSQQRKELSEQMGEMTKKIEKMGTDSYAFNLKMSEMISNNLLEMRKGNEEKLEQMRLTVDEKLSETLTKRLDSSFKTVSEQLENVYKSLGEMKVLSTGVTENVTSLNRILTNVKARGTWAEVQLEGLLDQTIPGMFERNVMTNPASKNIVEFAVKIPSSDDKSAITYLPIDSKFPVESYIRLCDAADRGDTAAVESERKALESTVINQAKEIKKYINEPATTPFAIMYLATEGLYSEIISSKNAVAERCHNEFGVMVAGPSTITALLNSLSVGFKAMAINEKAKEVRVVLAAAKVQYDKFGVLLEKARKKIGEAGKSLDEAQSRNNIIQKKLKSVEEIDRTSAIEILGLEDSDEGDEE